MKNLKVMAIMGMLGLTVMLLPKASLATDVSVGFFMGFPVPVVTIDPPRLHHVPPPVVVAPAPVYPRWHAYRPAYWHNKNFRNDHKGRFVHQDFGYRDQGRGHGNYRYDRDGRWDRR